MYLHAPLWSQVLRHGQLPFFLHQCPGVHSNMQANPLATFPCVAPAETAPDPLPIAHKGTSPEDALQTYYTLRQCAYRHAAQAMRLEHHVQWLRCLHGELLERGKLASPHRPPKASPPGRETVHLDAKVLEVWNPAGWYTFPPEHAGAVRSAMAAHAKHEVLSEKAGGAQHLCAQGSLGATMWSSAVSSMQCSLPCFSCCSIVFV